MDDFENDIYGGVSSTSDPNYDPNWTPVAGVDDLSNLLSTGGTSPASSNFLSRLFGGNMTSGDKAGTLLGLGALAIAQSLANKPPAIKQPVYKQAPVYNRALTAPMYGLGYLNSQTGKQVGMGMPLFFNPNPFQFDPTEAAKRYGPTPEQIAAGQQVYQQKIAELYTPRTVPDVQMTSSSPDQPAAKGITTGDSTGATTRTTTGGTTGITSGDSTIRPPKDAAAPKVPPPPAPSTSSTQTTITDKSLGASKPNVIKNTDSAFGMDQDLLNLRSDLGIKPSQAPGSSIRSQIGFNPVTGKPITGNEPEIAPVVNIDKPSSVPARPTAAQLAAEYAKQDLQMKAYQAALRSQQATLQAQELAKQKANAPYTSTTVQDFDEFGTPFYRSQTTEEMTAAGKDPTGMERLERTSPIVWGPTTSFYGGQVPSGASGGTIDDILAGYDGGEIGYNDGGDVYAYAKGQYLQGNGDGMSDSIPATINNKQPARLSDGEFVIPADVVAHLGNGSSKAGAQKLYDMMARVRKARTGTEKQAPEINPNKFV